MFTAIPASYSSTIFMYRFMGHQIHAGLAEHQMGPVRFYPANISTSEWCNINVVDQR